MSSTPTLTPANRKLTASLPYHVLSAVLFALFIAGLSLLNRTWVNYPGGNDAQGHLSKIQFIARFWPNTRWGYIWYDGTPLFRWYGPLPEHIVGLFVKATGLPAELALTLTFLSALLIVAIMIYFTVFSVTRSWSGSFLSALLALSCSFFWTIGIVAGFYARVITIAIFSVAMYYLFQFAKQSFEGNPKRVTLVLLVTFFSLSITGHPVTGEMGFVPLFFLCMLSPLSITRRLGNFLKVSILAGLLSVWFMLPGLYNAPAGVMESGLPWLKPVKGHFGLDDLLYMLTGVPIPEAHKPLASLSPVIIPLLIVLIALVWRSRKGSNSTSFSSVAVISLLLSSGIIVAYAFLVVEYIHLYFLILSLPITCGLLFHLREKALVPKVSLSRWPRSLARNGAAVILLCIIVASVFAQYPFSVGFPLSPQVRPISSYDAEDVVKELLVNETGTPNYRFGVPSDLLAWLQRRYPELAETRGYYATGVVNPDWIFWFEIGAWKNASYPEVNFLFDWSAVKWFAVYPLVNTTRYTSMPEFYQVAVDKHPRYGLVYRYATPIVSAGDTPTLLVIGKFLESYMAVFRDLSYSDYDSRYIIPIIGHEYVDDYDLAELMRFDAIALYGYNYHDRAKAYSLLTEYVANGGGLLIETGYSPDASSADIPTPSPVQSTSGFAPATAWDFSFAPSPVIEDIKFSSFSPAVYDGGSWYVSASSNSAIRTWASTTLWTGGNPVVVTGEYGKGRVAWSGLNLPFHIISYPNAHESQFLASMIRWVSRLDQRASANVGYTVERTTPENVVVRIINPASEVLFKEFYVENWHATVIDAAKSSSELPISKAGPGFMCIALPTRLTYPIEVHFDYRTTTVENVSNIVSAATFVALVLYVVVPQLFDRIRRVLGLPAARLRGKARSMRDRLTEPWQEER